MTRRRQSGYTLMELVVAMSIMCIFLGILLTVTLEMWNWEKRLPVNYMKHPQIIAVIARMQRDVIDAYGTNPYLKSHDGYESSEKVLIIKTLVEVGGVQTIVWDLSKPGVAVRRAYNVGNVTAWEARGVPVDLFIEAEEIAGRTAAVRLIAKDENGRKSIDQVFFPRATDDPLLRPPPTP